MANNSSNAIIYSTLEEQSLLGLLLPNGTAAGTITEVLTASSRGSVLLDILFRSSSTSVIYFDIIFCPTGQQATSPSNVKIPIAANSGEGGVALASLISLCPQLFAIDLAGNRVISVEAGQSVYVRNASALSIGQIVITKKARNY